MVIANTSVPVTVLPSPHHGGLGITRSLGRLGIPVFNVDANRWAPSFFSRYCRGSFVWDMDRAGSLESLEYLLKIAQRIGQRSILIPATDGASLLMAGYAKQLSKHFIFHDQSEPLVQSLCSKKEMYRLAGSLHIPVPVSVFPQTRSDLGACVETLGLPLMIKAIQGSVWNRASKTKILVRSIGEFQEISNRIAESVIPDLLVQEYIPGGEDTLWMFNGYFNDRSDCLAAFTGRKLRQCPVNTGVASFGICEANAAVAESARAFMHRIGYRGIVDMDFRFDARDGQYKVLDVNPRIGSSFRLFVSKDGLNEEGLDVARALYLDLTGQPVPAASEPEGRKWLVEDLDFVAALRYRREKRLTAWSWLKSMRGVRETAFLDFKDPLPALMMLRSDANELARRARPRKQPVPAFEHKPEHKSAPAPDDKHAYL